MKVRAIRRRQTECVAAGLRTVLKVVRQYRGRR